MIRKFMQHQKIVALGISLLFLSVFILPYFWKISIFCFSDGIPLLIRLNDLNQQNLDFLSYLFLKHGNSVHSIIYFLAWLDNVLFSSTFVFLKYNLLVGMFGTALLINWVTYRKQVSFVGNLIVFMLCDVLIAGTYNCDLYVPFQNCLTLTRLIYVFLLWQMAKCLIPDGDKRWPIWMACSVSVAPLHGMGMMFSLALFYLHVVTRQRLNRILISLTPFMFYTLIQLFFSQNYGEVSNVSSWLFVHFKELCLSILAFYGGLSYILFGFHSTTSQIIGAIIFILTGLTLSYFAIRAFWRIKFLPDWQLKDRTAIFALGLLGISFLCAFGSAAFTVARTPSGDAATKYNAVKHVLYAGRYLCYGVVPYLILIYAVSLAFTRKIYRKLLGAVGIILLVWLIYRNGVVSEKITFSRNRTLDANAVALLSKLDLNSAELLDAYGNFANGQPYYQANIPKLYQQLQIDNKYIYYNQIPFGARISNVTPKQIAEISNVKLDPSSDSLYAKIAFDVSVKINQRYVPLITEKGEVVGFAFKTSKPGFELNGTPKKWIFKRYYSYSGYVLWNRAVDNKLYAVVDEHIAYELNSTVSGSKTTTWPPMKVPQKIKFSEQDLPFEVSGLSFAEDWGRWTDGNRVHFTMNLPQDRPLQMVFEDVHAFVPPKNPIVTVTVFANQTKIGDWEFREGVVYPTLQFILSKEILNKQKLLSLTFVITGAQSPNLLGLGQDTRKLGLGFHNLLIEPTK
ncbi:MAG: hypothetical protein J6V32_04415 [Elusimicrobiaceae bacterium]|nr:hypothetical protein [Elusimicrobiaceae bacterium]